MSNYTAISWREQAIFDEMMITMSDLYETNRLRRMIRMFIMLGYQYNNSRVDMSFHTDTLSFS